MKQKYQAFVHFRCADTGAVMPLYRWYEEWQDNRLFDDQSFEDWEDGTLIPVVWCGEGWEQVCASNYEF